MTPRARGGRQIHDHFEFGGLLNRQIAGLSAFEKPIDQDGGTAEHDREVHPIAKQSSTSGKLRETDRGKSLGCHHASECLRVRNQHAVIDKYERFDVLSDQGGKRACKCVGPRTGKR